MEISIKYSRAAFKRGISEEDIDHALINVRYDNKIDNANEKYLLLGNDKSGSLLEIMYNKIIDEANETICIFHAMKSRSSFLSLLELEGNYA